MSTIPTTRSWRLPATSPSLPEVHSTLAVPTSGGFWRKLLAFAGPGFLVAVGCMHHWPRRACHPLSAAARLSLSGSAGGHADRRRWPVFRIGSLVLTTGSSAHGQGILRPSHGSF